MVSKRELDQLGLHLVGCEFMYYFASLSREDLQIESSGATDGYCLIAWFRICPMHGKFRWVSHLCGEAILLALILCR